MRRGTKKCILLLLAILLLWSSRLAADAAHVRGDNGF